MWINKGFLKRENAEKYIEKLKSKKLPYHKISLRVHKFDDGTIYHVTMSQSARRGEVFLNIRALRERISKLEKEVRALRRATHHANKR